MEFNRCHVKKVHYIVGDFPIRSQCKGRLGHMSNMACEFGCCVRLKGNFGWQVSNVKPGIQRTKEASIELKQKLLEMGKEKLKADHDLFVEFRAETIQLPVAALRNFNHEG